ncbi:peptidylprolyl isomerase [Flavobacterium sp. GCM10027622]|uniref:peptidylprolyl isomerase n=1 Tax=unclassified Flavobacterium TaxID=196869 RepID=UPI003616AE61
MKKPFIALAFLVLGCGKPSFSTKWMDEKAPETFQARFESSQGDFEVEFTRDLSPKAVDRIYQQINHKFYDGIVFYRVVPNFVAQFGHMDSTATANNWDRYKVEDEPVKGSNVKGTISYARSGPNSRGNHLFINLKDNKRLDTVAFNRVKGFPTLGKVTKGMEVVEKLYSGYGNETMNVYDTLAVKRKEFMKKFPKLDSIKKAYIVK